MPKNWKYIKKLLEKEFLCEKLRGHITYDLTGYRTAPGYYQHFIFKYDDEVLLDVPHLERQWDKRYDRPILYWNHHAVIAERIRQKYHLEEYSLSPDTIESIVCDAIDEADKLYAHHKGVYGVNDVIDAIGAYLRSDIETSLDAGQDHFICALAILDRRCGRKKLERYARWDYTSIPEWLRRIYQIRFEAEGVRYDKHYEIQKRKGAEK